MRKLYLTNDSGISFELRNDVLISSIEGLGILNENTYFKYGTKYEKFSTTMPQTQIVLGLVFIKGYSGFLDFVEFIKKSKKLRLFYSTVDEKYCNVEVNELTKSQLEFGVLKSTLRLDRLSKWLKKVDMEIDVKESNDSKVYQHTYPFIYQASSNGRIRVINNGHCEAEVIIKIIGNVKDPELQVIQFGKVIQTLRLLISGHGIYEVSSISSDSFIKKDGSNIYEHQDFTCTNFIRIPLGEVEMFFDSGVTNSAQCYISMFEEYEAN